MFIDCLTLSHKDNQNNIYIPIMIRKRKERAVSRSLWDFYIL